MSQKFNFINFFHKVHLLIWIGMLCYFMIEFFFRFNEIRIQLNEKCMMNEKKNKIWNANKYFLFLRKTTLSNINWIQSAAFIIACSSFAIETHAVLRCALKTISFLLLRLSTLIVPLASHRICLYLFLFVFIFLIFCCCCSTWCIMCLNSFFIYFMDVYS